MKTIYTDALVIGGGLAGLRTAIGIKRRGHDVIVLSLVPPKRSHSAAAQGGMQASIGNCVKGTGDNEDIHFFDTIRGSDWGADQKVARMFVNTAPKAVRELALWGVPWNRVEAGPNKAVIDGKEVTIDESQQSAGLITARNFGGTQKWRTSYVSDGTGHSMLYCMSNQALAEKITVHQRMEAISLIHHNKRCLGAIVRDLKTGELMAYVAKATCIATGGFGRIYQNTTNAIINEGIGAAIALETGVAQLANMEAVQFHPTAIFPAGILVTEGCRGDGGLLLDKDLHRFMSDYEPEKKELASRDVVSRWMEVHIAKGKGVQSRFGEHLWLDIRLLGKKHIETHLREVKEICQYFLGIDPVNELIPVRPAQHYSMGGIRTDYTGQSPELSGLFACGEAACWDLHGFNRLGGNSVAETVVAGMIVGDFIADFVQSPLGDIEICTTVIEHQYKQQQQRLARFIAQEAETGAFTSENPIKIRQEMQAIMSKNVAIFREKDSLKEAIKQLQGLLSRCDNIRVHVPSAGPNPELCAAYRVEKMLKLALCTAQGALNREESRGAHFRKDFPLRNDKDWLSRTLYLWSPEQQSLMLRYEKLDIMSMELPPNWRGYGSKERVEHPNTTLRQQQVDEIKHTVQKQGGDRYAVQQQLMPYRHMLPDYLQAKNARLHDTKGNS
ncbi:fumarate reductase flavoprotein subunit [Thalassotalea aquiviva]|uniref:fumarate reductase flavoprotein subunit n=1 Tax=Thalassotalea aquiviva TaxID=3242415 RepID=UPI00352AD5DE